MRGNGLDTWRYMNICEKSVHLAVKREIYTVIGLAVGASHAIVLVHILIIIGNQISVLALYWLHLFKLDRNNLSSWGYINCCCCAVCKYKTMDTIVNVPRITSILLILIIVVVHSACSIEQNISASDTVTNFTQNPGDNGREISSPKVLSRRKRYVAFPEGSSFSVGFLIVIFAPIVFHLIHRNHMNRLHFALPSE